MDDTDLTILELLKENSRRSFIDIGSRVGLSEGAVRRRVKKLVEEGIIQCFTIETKSEVEAIVLIKTDPAKTREIAETVKSMSEKVFEASGDFDIAAFICASTLDEVNKIVDGIRGLPSVLSTSTLIKMA